MIVLHTFTTPPEPCAYLPHETSRLLYKIVAGLSPAEYESLLADGWRKFGMYLYRPVCEACRECRSLRIPLETFTPDRSQKRCLQANADLTVRFGVPVADDERIALYNRYHAVQNERKGWRETVKTSDDYTESFLRGAFGMGAEVSVWEGETLRAIALTDVTPSLVSGVYHYHEPGDAYRKRGLGTFVILQVLELARHLGKPYAHFGYYVAGCASLNYKARFAPCELQTASGDWEPVVS